jgi:hypothetical protein
MHLLLIIGGSALFLSGGFFASKTGDAVEKTGNASLKIGAVGAVALGAYLYWRKS